jgi:hypothetical protein
MQDELEMIRFAQAQLVVDFRLLPPSTSCLPIAVSHAGVRVPHPVVNQNPHGPDNGHPIPPKNERLVPH